MDDRTASLADESSRPSRLRLIGIIGGAAVTYDLPASGTVVIGRGTDVDIRIDHTSISRRHAALHITDRIELEDLGSSNGSGVREQTLAANQRVQLRPGETMRVGGITLVLRGHLPSASVGDTAETESASAAMKPVYALCAQIAKGEINVLVLGETGVGKEVMAERIHRQSPRHAAPLLKLNCATLSETLLEAELFGYERGAFTGAERTKPGLLETAQGGTVFLDELGELPLGLQAKLLRVIDERKVMRVGGLKPIPIDVRFVAATNRDLEIEIAAGRFRQDLYYRLNGVALQIPPLRERRDEIPYLFQRFASLATKGAPPAIDAGVIELLERYPWPGNIRELRNVVERAVLLCGDGPIAPAHLPLDKMRASKPAIAVPVLEADDEPDKGTLREELDALERERIEEALRQCAGNQSAAAKLLGMPRPTLLKRLDAYGIARPRKK